MQITVFSGFTKKLNSTKRPTGGRNIDVALKTPTSEKTPTFLISGFDLSWNYIQWGASYYYVDDVVVMSNTQAEYHCRRDTLATFRGEILSSSQLVARNANTYQPALSDAAYPAYNKATINRTPLGSWDTALDTTNGRYIVGVICPESSNGLAYYSFTPTQYQNFLNYLFSDVWLDPNSDIGLDIQKELINPFQYVSSVMWFPLDIVGDMTNLRFGFWNTGTLVGKLGESRRVVTIETTATLPRHPQQTTHGIHMNGSPYSRYNLDCWCFGSIPIDPLPFVDNNAIGLRIQVDLFTGVANLKVTNANGGVVASVSNQFGVPIQISQMSQSVINPVINTVGGFQSAIGGAITGHAVSGVLGLASGISNAIHSAMPQVQSMGAIGSKIAYTSTPTITATFYTVPPLAAAKIGRPLMEVKTLSSLTGFTKCETVDLDTNACPDEKREIIDFMLSGFFIE